MVEGDDRNGRPSNWYEQMLWEIAGEQLVPTGRIFLVWAAGMSIIAGTVYLAGGRTEGSYFSPFGFFSGPYWVIAVPAYVHRKYRRRPTEEDETNFDDNPWPARPKDGK